MVLLGAPLGLLAGALSGLLAAILTLLGRRLRNAALVARGQHPVRDLLLPPFAQWCAVLGLLLGPLGGLSGSWRGSLLAAASPSALLLLVSLAALAVRALERESPP